MGLVAWYRFDDGDARDYSGNDNHGEAHGATPADGKIGQAMEFDGNDYVSFQNPLIEGQSFSIAFWAKTFATSNQCFACTRTVVGNGLSIFILDGNYLRFDTGSQWSTGYLMPTDKWVHIAATRDGHRKALYVNGKLFSSTASVGTMATLSDVFMLGASHSNGSSLGNYLRGNIDDMRIYDHALSEKEVKELSKAKILHMKFDDFQEPTSNLLYSNGEFTPSINSLQCAVSSVDTLIPNRKFLIRTGDLVSPYTYGTIRLHVPLEVLNDGQTYNISFKYRIISGAEFSISDWCDSTTTKSPVVDHGSYYFASAYGSRATYTSSYRFVDLSVSPNSEIEIWDIQLEEKSHATPFVDGERPGTVHDCSGYDNHAELALATTPRWTDEAKIGSGCYEFDGSSQYFKIPKYSKNDNVTISLWVNTSQSLGSQILIGDHNSIGIGIHNGTIIGTCAFSKPAGILDNNFKNNSWNHISVVSDNGDMRYYCNGVLLQNGNNNTWSWSNDSFAVIGRRSPGSTSTPYYVNGLVDDVRIYATALSDDDIKELYQNRASLDSRGNFYFHQLEQPPATEGLVGWWKLDGNAKDSSGHNNHGTVSGATITDGIMGQAYEFIENSVVNNISFGDVTSYKITQTLWINKKSLSEIHRICNIRPFACGFSGSSFFAHNATSAGSDNNVPYGTINLETNKWHFLAIVRDMIDDKKVRVYLDGKLRLEGVPPNAIGGYMTMGNFTIGHSSSTQYFDGKIDDVRIYNRALSETEIDVLYKTGRGLI
jgi:hypothetical protein